MRPTVAQNSITFDGRMIAVGANGPFIGYGMPIRVRHVLSVVQLGKSIPLSAASCHERPPNDELFRIFQKYRLTRAPKGIIIAT
jgi:hypothetical protein